MYSFFLQVFLVPKSREIQHLFMIYIRAWYLESAQQPPPPWSYLPSMMPQKQLKILSLRIPRTNPYLEKG